MPASLALFAQGPTQKAQHRRAKDNIDPGIYDRVHGEKVKSSKVILGVTFVRGCCPDVHTDL